MAKVVFGAILKRTYFNKNVDNFMKKTKQNNFDHL